MRRALRATKERAAKKARTSSIDDGGESVCALPSAPVASSAAPTPCTVEEEVEEVDAEVDVEEEDELSGPAQLSSSPVASPLPLLLLVAPSCPGCRGCLFRVCILVGPSLYLLPVSYPRALLYSIAFVDYGALAKWIEVMCTCTKQPTEMSTESQIATCAPPAHVCPSVLVSVKVGSPRAR